jgi:glycosyltransferase involved in cell wall biosynthesis
MGCPPFVVPEFEFMRVDFLVGTLGRGGAERQLLYMLRTLIHEGVSLRVLCLNRGEPLEEEVNDLGVPVEWVGQESSRVARLRAITSAVQRPMGPNILQSSHFYTNTYAAVAARTVGVREIGAIRNNVTSELRSNIPFGVGHLLLPRTMIANSARACATAVKLRIPRRGVYLVPNVVDIEQYRPCPLRLSNGQKSSPVQLFFVGRLTRAKRLDRFLRVLSLIDHQLPLGSWQATIVGNGPLRAESERLALSLGLTDKVVFLGERTPDELLVLYRQADILLLTSDWEGTPNVLLEAMACGVPVIATRVGGVHEIVDNKRGIIVDPEDEVGLAQAALKLIKNAPLRTQLGEHGRAYVQYVHALELLGKRLINIYSEVLEKKRANE